MDPAELYDVLCWRRREHGIYGMLTPWAELGSPLLRGESDVLLAWLESGDGPRDVGMVAALQHHWFTVSQAERAAAALRWRHCGGRALHAFVGDAAAPLCGVVATRADGTAPRWRDGTARHWRFDRRSRHGDCMRAARDGGHAL